MNIQLKDAFVRQLPADPNTENTIRQVYESCFSYVTPNNEIKPTLIHGSKEVGSLLGINNEDFDTKDFLNYFSGKKVIEGSTPYAMCYGGHQFGHWSGQLGDGRAINIGEVEYDHKKWAVQLKGAGKTPYSRQGDGLAVMRSSIREHLCSEAMYHLGVPSTRSLSLMKSGNEVLRDMFYDGNAAYEKGAIVCRIAESFVRFGNIEIFARRGDKKNLKRLVDYIIDEFYPEVKMDVNPYISFFKKVMDHTLEMVIHWQRIGFVHGVMNTDNMSVLGLTMDYGPYGWMESYTPDWTPNTSDVNHRYSFQNQPAIAQWNLYQLANALFVLVGEGKPLEDIISQYHADYQVKYLEMMKTKLGLEKYSEKDEKLISDLLEVMELTNTDMTIFFRNLSKVSKKSLIHNIYSEIELIKSAFYELHKVDKQALNQWYDWLSEYLKRLEIEDLTDDERKMKMNAVNPKYILRNYISQMIIDKAEIEDYSLLEEIYTLLQNPYDEQEEHEKWFAKRPDWAENKAGCSRLSCSS
ncbi:protein adenylyltransferase SelO [Flammeovirga agarivorans]|uniref:Protein nucleotidyltransferase YdiU n=1 Tax=Flammeovirga agarivorans TaxID=2726742 RepID=A0A7X8SK61_9BACT|nr:YdiU family protein [Flammeovirga agarivorans]NLR91627.1 YdiU family protein [Flammeovirga agarivorans]